jgi:hypothetical protein
MALWIKRQDFLPKEENMPASTQHPALPPDFSIWAFTNPIDRFFEDALARAIIRILTGQAVTHTQA